METGTLVLDFGARFLKLQRRNRDQKGIQAWRLSSLSNKNIWRKSEDVIVVTYSYYSDFTGIMPNWRFAQMNGNYVFLFP